MVMQVTPISPSNSGGPRAACWLSLSTRTPALDPSPPHVPGTPSGLRGAHGFSGTLTSAVRWFFQNPFILSFADDLFPITGITVGILDVDNGSVYETGELLYLMVWF